MRRDPTHAELHAAITAKRGETVAEIEGCNPESVRYAMWHPQWGGYSSRCAVEFPRPTSQELIDEGVHPDPPGTVCFDVYEFHDGDFPRDTLQFERHYCCPLQLAAFGVSILELQHAIGHDILGEEHNRREIETLIARLQAILYRRSKA